MSSSSFLNASLILIVALNLLFTAWNAIQYFPQSREPASQPNEHTYIGRDFPRYHPHLDIKLAAMTLQESARYALNASDSIASAEWETFNMYPGGFGRTHLGPDRRSFLMTFYHQLHCVRELQKAVVNRSDTAATQHHVNHCLQYLRQTFMCGAHNMIEKGDFMERDYQTERIGSELVCWDWELMYAKLDGDWSSFTDWRAKWN